MKRSGVSSSEKQAKRTRQCSVCGSTLHTRRTCDDTAFVAKKKAQKPVIVHVRNEAVPSLHIVELDRNRRTIDWGAVHAYHDTVGKEERVVVDFAHMIRQANNTTLSNIEKKIIVPAKKFQLPKLALPHVDIVGRIKNINHAVQDRIQRTYGNIQDSISLFNFKRFATSSIVLLLVVALPFPALAAYKKIQNDTARIVGESTNAFLSLQSSTVAAFKNNIPQAEFDLNAALQSFTSAQNILDKDYRALIYVGSVLPVVGNKISSREHLLMAGHNMALGNTYLVKGVDEATQKNENTIIQRMGILRDHLRSALPQYEEALNALGYVESEALPVEYQQSFGEFKVLFAGLISDMHQMVDVISGVQKIMGSDGFKRYLVLFQNNHELRPTGGFVGSYATIDVQNGKILSIDVPKGGSYDVQGQLNIFLKPPVPLQVVNKRWEFQDGNWFPDFSASAQKMAWFYQHSRNTTVDGVIAINASVLERLLRVLGPLQSDEYSLLLDSDNALEQIEHHVEIAREGSTSTTPKAILSDLLGEMMSSMNTIEPTQIVSLVSELHGALQEKEIQFYFTDNNVQQLFSSYGWTGEVVRVESSQDYLMVVNTNVGGGKSDAEMQQNIEHQAVVQEDGSVIDTVIIKRTHIGAVEGESDGERNVDYVRVYVPEGSELLEAGGFSYPEETSFLVPPATYEDDVDLARFEHENSVHVQTGTRITSEFGKTAFGNWIVTYPGQESQVFFTYRLPPTVAAPVQEEGIQHTLSKYTSDVAALFGGRQTTGISSHYSICMQKQSGAVSTMSHMIIYPENWRPAWKLNDNMKLSQNGGLLSDSFTTDIISGIVMEKIK